MYFSTARKLIIGSVVSLMAASATVFADEEIPHSGFLGDESIYAKLETVKFREGVEGQRWIGPMLTADNYKSVFVEDVVLYPAPEPTDQVSQETLDEISEFLTQQAREKTGSVLNLAEEPGPQVIRLRIAVTGVMVKTEGMKAYEVVPVAAIFGGLKAATGKRDMDTFVFMEARYEDSQTGELLAAGMRKLEGKQLEGKKDELELKDMKDTLEQVSIDGTAALEETMKE